MTLSVFGIIVKLMADDLDLISCQSLKLVCIPYTAKGCLSTNIINSIEYLLNTSQWIDKACHMFGVNAVEMTKALIKPRIKVGNEYVHKGQNAEQVSWSW